MRRTLLLLGALTAACGPRPASESQPSAQTRPDVIELTPDAIANAGITVQAAAAVTRAQALAAPGLIVLDEARTARIGSLQEGLIVEATAQVGDRVGARQTLARMHSHDVHDAWAGYRKALAERRRAETQLAYATEAHERAKRLFTDKAVSLQEVQRAEVERVTAAQAVDTAQAEVIRAIEELEHVGIDVPATGPPAGAQNDQTSEQIPVRTPIAGVVLERLVTPGTTVTPGTPLFVVSELTTLWAVAEVDEALLSRIRTGRPVEIAVAAYPDQRFAGTITFIADTVNPKTRRVTVRSTVPNLDGRLKPEMFATVTLGEGDARPVVVVPPGAVQTMDGRAVVFVETSPGRFTMRPVELGAESGGQVEIVTGVAAGDRIVANGSFVLKSELLKAANGGS
jgi:cobalt-zinc-cadmium efflux system membrane fusion protein